MMKSNRLIIAAAGSGKTSFLVKEALKIQDDKILITTYTQANEQGIRNKFFKLNGCIPKNITIQTWFSFLIQHGVKPYQGSMGLADFDCKGLLFISGQSAQYIKEANILEHYFSEEKKIYSDKLAKFVIQSNNKSRGAVINRISRVYDQIFIDEVQDLAGYDLDIIKLLFDSNSKILLVGDPRQCTYVTHNSQKNKKYKRGKITDFFDENSTNLIKEEPFNTNYRCHTKICDLSNKMYPEYVETTSGNSKLTGHDGVFLVAESKLEQYLKEYNPVQLCWNATVKTSSDYPTLNFGISKGLEFERTLIYPTKPFIDWLKSGKELAPKSKAQLYVAITRAKQSIGIVCKDTEQHLSSIPFWNG